MRKISAHDADSGEGPNPLGQAQPSPLKPEQAHHEGYEPKVAQQWSINTPEVGTGGRTDADPHKDKKDSDKDFTIPQMADLKKQLVKKEKNEIVDEVESILSSTREVLRQAELRAERAEQHAR